MSTAHAIAQLRHLYSQMIGGDVRYPDEAARGLLGPAIAELERAAAPQPEPRERVIFEPSLGDDAPTRIVNEDAPRPGGLVSELGRCLPGFAEALKDARDASLDRYRWQHGLSHFCLGCGKLPPHSGSSAICAACMPPNGTCDCAGCALVAPALARASAAEASLLALREKVRELAEEWEREEKRCDADLAVAPNRERAVHYGTMAMLNAAYARTLRAALGGDENGGTP